MIQVLRVWPDQGVNVWYTVKEPLTLVNEHLAKVIAHWDSAAFWYQMSEYTWKNGETGERVELVSV